MKSPSTNKLLLFILAVLFTLQSCQIYQPVPVSLEEAANSELKTKIITQNGDDLRFKKIISENQEFFGLKKKNGNLVKFAVDEDEITAIFLKDKKKSTWANIALFVGIPLGFFLISFIIFLITWT